MGQESTDELVGLPKTGELVDTTTAIKLREQEGIAIDCLKKHREGLRSLASLPGVEADNLAVIYRVSRNALKILQWTFTCAYVPWAQIRSRSQLLRDDSGS